MATITQQVLLNRLAEFEQREQQAIADANAAHGAIIALQELLQVLDLPDDFVAQPVIQPAVLE